MFESVSLRYYSLYYSVRFSFLTFVLFAYSPVEDLADTAVGHSELAGDDAGPDPGRRHLDDFEPDVIWKRPAIDEDAPQLVNSTLT